MAKPAPAHTLDVYRVAEIELMRLLAPLRQGTLEELDGLFQAAGCIVESLMESDHLIADVLSGRSSEQLITNSINVSILATKIGMGFAYEREELEQLALAGLLHDAGMFSIPEAILMKSEPLSASERELIEQHPDVGAEVLSSLGTTYSWLADVASQEHERWNGQGYPNQISGPAIHPHAQIIGIADIFEALVSPRPYRHRFLPHEAVRELLVAEKAAFSRDIMKTVIDQLSMYPLGTHVRLNSGEVGVVKELKSRYPMRPIVQMDSKDDGGPEESKIVDLSTTKMLHIVEVVKPVEAA